MRDTLFKKNMNPFYEVVVYKHRQRQLLNLSSKIIID